MSNRKQRGFTLLEVIVALAISGFILGGLFSLLGSSKQLSWASEENLLRAARIRAATNFALLQNEYRDVGEILEHDLRHVPERSGISKGEVEGFVNRLFLPDH